MSGIFKISCFETRQNDNRGGYCFLKASYVTTGLYGILQYFCLTLRAHYKLWKAYKTKKPCMFFSCNGRPQGETELFSLRMRKDKFQVFSIYLSLSKLHSCTFQEKMSLTVRRKDAPEILSFMNLFS